MTHIIIILCAAAAGLVQGVTGFGAGIIFMSVVPYFLSLISSAGLSTCMSVVLTLAMAIKYRKHIQWKLIPIPVLFFILGSTLAITIAPNLEVRMMKIVFGIFLMVLAAYFIFFSEKAHIQANTLTMFVCGFVSGICDGLFGVGGPLMVLFYLALTKTKEEYLATIQAFFAITVSWNFVYRIIRGLFSADLLVMAVLAGAGAFLGVQAGHKVVNKLDGALLKKLTYALIGISGIITLVTSL